MRLLPLLAVLLSVAAPLPGVPALPDGSEVRVLREELRSIVSSGTVRAGVLALAPRPPAGERVQLWIAMPGGDGGTELKQFPAEVARDAQDLDVYVEAKKSVSFKLVLEKAYGVRLELPKR